jgi:hypothetical protein
MRLASTHLSSEPNVAVTAQHMPTRLQLAPQLGVVVDLAVLHGPNPQAFVREWLMPTSDVDDREPPGTERAAAAGHMPVIVRAPVGNDVGHRPQHFSRDRRCPASI